MKKLLFGLLLVAMFSCTKNARVKAFGGEAVLNLPPNTKLVNVTWKETNLWILTKEMSDKDIPERYSFKEESNFGIMEGNYIINESKK